MSISVTSAYGPQNSALGIKKEAFWTYLTEQASRAKEAGKGFILQGDLNAWLGSELLPGDKKPQNSNGKMLETFLKNNNLICVNSLPFSKGLVTRTRKYLGEVKQSTIDFYVVCQRVLPHISSMEIIDHTEHSLTNYSALNTGEAAVTSDHGSKTRSPSSKKGRKEKNEDDEAKKRFKKSTSETQVFTETFENMQQVSQQSEQWLAHVKTYIKKSFKKIRIKPRKMKPSSADWFISKKHKMLRHDSTRNTGKLDALIAKTISEEGQRKALMFRQYTNKPSMMSKMWKLKKKLFPKKASTVPTAKENYSGKIITEPKELVNLIGEEYGRVRLRKRPTHPFNIEGKKIRKEVLKLKIKLASQRKSPPFKMKDLENVLKSIKKKKAHGPEGISRTIFKESIIGTNLKLSLLIMFNKIKESGEVPSFMKKAIVVTIPKKGSKIKLEN